MDPKERGSALGSVGLPGPTRSQLESLQAQGDGPAPPLSAAKPMGIETEPAPLHCLVLRGTMGVGSGGARHQWGADPCLSPPTSRQQAEENTPCPFPLPQSPVLWLDGAEMPIKGICQCYHWHCPGKTPVQVMLGQGKGECQLGNGPCRGAQAAGLPPKLFSPLPRCVQGLGETHVKAKSQKRMQTGSCVGHLSCPHQYNS